MLNPLLFAVTSYKIFAILFPSDFNRSTMPTISVSVLAVQLIGTSRLAAINGILSVVCILAIYVLTISLRALTRSKFPGNFLSPTFGSELQLMALRLFFP